ncbi:MAG: helix-turn-helix domain-containing protein [Nitrospirota bacterium]|nr:helix-turn-helix domain-containing protein [Nitrospirota bacterium]
MNSKLEPSSSTSAAELGRRISDVAVLLGTREAAAKIGGVSKDQLGRYISGTSKPPLEVIARMAEAAGVRIDWVWNGIWPMREGELDHVGARAKGRDYGSSETAMRKRATDPEAFNARLKIVCEGFKGGVNALSRASGVAAGEINRILGGAEPTRDQLVALADATGTDIQWLITGAVPGTTEGSGAVPELPMVPELFMAVAEALKAVMGAQQCSFDDLTALTRTLHNQIVSMSGGDAKALKTLRPDDVAGVVRLALRLREGVERGH